MNTNGKTCTDFLKKNLLKDDNNVISVLPDSYIVASLLGTSQMLQKNKSKRSGRGRRRRRRRKGSIISSVIMGEEDDDDGDEEVNVDDYDESIRDTFSIDDKDEVDDDGLIFLNEDDYDDDYHGTEKMKSTKKTERGRTVALRKSNYVVTDYDPIASYLASTQNDNGDADDNEEMNEIVDNFEIGGVPVVPSYNIDVHKEKDHESGEVKYRTKKKRIKHGDVISTSELNIRLRIMEQCINPTVQDILNQRKMLDDPEVQNEIKRNKERDLERIIDDIVGSVVFGNTNK